MLAKDRDTPVARFAATHDGLPHDEGIALGEEMFSGLPPELEICEGAPILATSNVWVSAGLLNGTRGTIQAIVYRHGDRPDHDDPRRQLPHVILADCPSYSGPAFFDSTAFPERRHWVPFFPREISTENDKGIRRTQYTLTLAWAITPWKAQGMTLERLVVKLGEAAGRPGVAFVALSRATHPDGLALDDFPAMSLFQRQKKHKSFQQRQRFERVARARFSRTIRTYMRDPKIYSQNAIWTLQEASCAENILLLIKRHPQVNVQTLVEDYYSHLGPSIDDCFSDDVLHKVWQRLHSQYPHMFAVALVRGELDSLNLDGTRMSVSAIPQIQTQLNYHGWTVTLDDIQAFTLENVLSPAIFELYLRLFVLSTSKRDKHVALGNSF